MTTFAEFRHWLEGFSESIGDAPTPAQWARIKEKLAQVDPLQRYPSVPVEITWPFRVPDGPSPYWSPSVPSNAPPFLWPYTTCNASDPDRTEIVDALKPYASRTVPARK